MMVGNWVSILHASILDTFIFARETGERRNASPDACERTVKLYARELKTGASCLFLQFSAVLIIITDIFMGGGAVCGCVNGAASPQTGTSNSEINKHQSCVRAFLLHVHAETEKSPHQSDTGPLFDPVPAGFREQIKAGPEGCSMGLILL